MLCILKDPKCELIKFLDAVVSFRLGAVKELNCRAGEQLRLKAVLEMSNPTRCPRQAWLRGGCSGPSLAGF